MAGRSAQKEGQVTVTDKRGVRRTVCRSLSALPRLMSPRLMSDIRESSLMRNHFPLNKAMFRITPPPTLPNADRSDDEVGPLIIGAFLRCHLP